MTLVFEILSIIANIVYFFVLRMELYTDTAILPDGERTYNYNAITKLSHAGSDGMVSVQFVFAVISVILAILLIAGVKKKIVTIAWIISTAISAILFAAILLYAGSVQLKY